MINEVKNFIETIQDEKIHSELIFHLFTVCEMSVEDISYCYDNCTPKTIVDHIFEVYNIALKKCSREDCIHFGKYQIIDNFYKDKRMLYSHFRTSECKDCHKKQANNYYINNWKKVRLYQSGYVEENREILKEYNKQYINDKVEENPNYFKEQYQKYQEHQLKYHADRREDEEYREYMREYLKIYNAEPENIDHRNEYWRDRYRDDIKFRLKQTMGNRIRSSLMYGKNNETVENVLGYKIDDLIIHLESQFDDKMNWINYGSYWQIDHIVPIAAFDYTSYEDDAFKKCWSLQNLQPLYWESNLSKHDMISEEWKNIELAAQLL